MTLQIKSLSDTLKSILQNTDFSDVSSSAVSAVNNFDASIKTILGSSVGEVLGGIQALNKVVDKAEDFANPQQVPTISRITANIPVLGNTLIGSMPSASGTDVLSITGTAAAAADGFLQEIISVGSPEAISSAMKKVTGSTTASMTKILKSLTTTELRSVVTSAVDTISYQELQSALTIFLTQLNSSIGANSKFFLADLGEKIEKNYENSINLLVDRDISSTDVASTFVLVANKKYNKAFTDIVKYIDTPDDYDYITENFPPSEWPDDVTAANDKIDAAESDFKILSVELSTYMNPYFPGSDAAGTNISQVIDINSTTGNSNASVSDGDTWNFDEISSGEELESIFRNINRVNGQEITGAIIHWSSTFLDQNIGSKEINATHIKKGYIGIGYHIVIKRDGTIQRARPMNRVGAHDINNDNNFLGICFVGGINEFANKAQKPYWRYASTGSLTPAQFNSYDTIMKTFHSVFSYAQVQGHYATSNNGDIDPGFDVTGYSQAKFGHQNVISENDPRWKTPDPIDLAAITAEGNTP